MVKRSPQKISRLKSFVFAFAGLKALWKYEKNFRIHLGLSILVLIGCYFFHVKPYEWIIILILVGMVLCLEALNTVIEYICDFISPQINIRIKIIKDIAAAAVLLGALTALTVGLIIFIPYFRMLL